MAYAVLINAITSMVLISIHPFALRKLFLLIVAFLCFSAFCFADPVLMVRRYSNHSDHLRTVTEPAPAFQEQRTSGPRSPEREALKSLDSRETKFQFAETENSSVDRAAPAIFGKAVCSMRPLHSRARLAVAPILTWPGDI